jgi:hypothetical protein
MPKWALKQKHACTSGLRGRGRAADMRPTRSWQRMTRHSKLISLR